MSDGNSGVAFGEGIPTNMGVGSFDVSQIATHLSPNVLYSVLAILVILMGGVTIVLYYHWLRYGFGDKMVLFAQILYTIVLLLSFIVMTSSASYYA